MNRSPRFKSNSALGIGSGVQMVSARVKAKVGAIVNIEIDEVRGYKGSLVNNLSASANG